MVVLHGAKVAHQITVRRLNLYDVGPHVPQNLGCVWPHQHCRHVNDAYTFQWATHARLHFYVCINIFCIV
ncbi:hypothetical protein PT7_0658 [Pusillimonas sp. T7-7]|nr:hypothetical protein PT7_0658 [Pusillimonas sp. T7-7]